MLLAAEEHQQLQQLRLTLNEMSTNESMLRQQIAEQDTALVSASADSAQVTQPTSASSALVVILSIAALMRPLC